MKKLKKIAAIAVASVTLAATAINACAAIKEKSIEMGEIEATYYLANNTIHYSELLDGFDKNSLIFSGVDKTLMEGNVVLTVDFDGAKKLKKMRDDGSAIQLMSSLHLKDADGKFITEGKYPLIADGNAAPRGCMNVMVGHPTIFFNFDLTQGNYTACGSKYNYLHLRFQIRDYMVLPSYKITLEEISSSSNTAKFTGEFVYNDFTTYNTKGYNNYLTTGNMLFEIPTKYAGKSFNAYINGMKVGKVTLPKEFGEKAALVNY